MNIRPNCAMRSKYLFLIPFLCLVYPSVHHQKHPGWNGILPLHSNRSDIERKLGISDDLCHCLYQTAKESIFVDYAKAPCKGPPYGWSVSKDTVLQITVYLASPIELSKLPFEEEKFTEVRDPDAPLTVYYTNQQDGIKYVVHNGNVKSIVYIPSTRDKSFRCQGFPDYEGGAREYHPFASFSVKAQMIDGRLDDLASQLATTTKLTGYIITYAGKISRQGEGKMMAERAKNHLTLKRGIPTNRVVAIDGGFREIAGYDLFLVPNTMPPPVPTPTVSSTQVKILGRKKSRFR